MRRPDPGHQAHRKSPFDRSPVAVGVWGSAQPMRLTTEGVRLTGMQSNNAPGRFPSTAWSMIAGLQGDSEVLARSLEALARSYWKPIFSFLRQALRMEHQDAEDVTQSFLAWLVEGGVLETYDPARGPFRPYLKTLLRNFVLNYRRAKRAEKRGGAAHHVHFDDIDEAKLRTGEQDSPETLFDVAWAEELIDRATKRLQEQMQDEGKDTEFAIFEAYELGPPGELPTYESVALALGVSANTVRHQLYKIRDRLRGEIRAELRNTVQDVNQLEQEWRDLLG